MTSTLQMEASRKLGMGAAATMRVAQRLYEAGHITYMRTDAVQMAREAIAAIREHVKAAFGADYLASAAAGIRHPARRTPRRAHERATSARPTSPPPPTAWHANSMRIGAEARLYGADLEARRSPRKMASAELDQTTVEIADASGKIRLRATGSVLVFDGFLKLYREDEDDRAADARAGLGKPDTEEETRLLPPMAEVGDPL